MDEERIAERLTREFVARSRVARFPYLDALQEMRREFATFGRYYLNTLGIMYETRGENPELDSPKMKKQRDAMAEAFSDLDNAISDHLRSVRGIR